MPNNNGCDVAIRYIEEMAFMRGRKQTTTQDLAKEFEISPRQARKDIEALQRMNHCDFRLYEVGEDDGDRHGVAKVWAVTKPLGK